MSGTNTTRKLQRQWKGLQSFLVDIFNPIPIRESDYAHCILNNFAEYLTPMLTLGPCSSANLVLDLKMWENLESNLPHTGTFDSNFSQISKDYSKFGLPYEDGSRTVMGVK